MADLKVTITVVPAILSINKDTKVYIGGLSFDCNPDREEIKDFIFKDIVLEGTTLEVRRGLNNPSVIAAVKTDQKKAAYSVNELPNALFKLLESKKDYIRSELVTKFKEYDSISVDIERQKYNLPDIVKEKLHPTFAKAIEADSKL